MGDVEMQESHDGRVPSPVLSLILCSRNDRYMGNSLWRLETTLNYLGKVVQDLRREHQVEVIVSDWGSTSPLVDVLNLDTRAAQITSFLAVPHSLASELQGDSPFAEVLALNAAARRARGEYIGRIDQDTLVGRNFLQTFFDLYEGRIKLEVPLDQALLFSTRRAIPYRVAARCPSMQDLCNLIDLFPRFLRVEWSRNKPFWRCMVGIWLVPRSLWEECRGYDERMLYLNDMEENMAVRLSKRYKLLNLGSLVDYAFFHLEHKHPWNRKKSARNRKVNDHSFKQPQDFVVNDESWGLKHYNLELRKAESTDSSQLTHRNFWKDTFDVVGFAAVGSLILFQMSIDQVMSSKAARSLRQYLERVVGKIKSLFNHPHKRQHV